MALAVAWLCSGCTTAYPVPAPKPVVVTDPMRLMLDEQEVILRSAELLGDSVVVGWVPGEQVSLAGSGWGGRSVLRDTVRVAIPVSRLMVPARRIDMGATALVGMGSLLGAFFLSMLIECGMFGC